MAATAEGVSPTEGDHRRFPHAIFLRRAPVGGTHTPGQHPPGGKRGVRPAPLAGDHQQHRGLSEPRRERRARGHRTRLSLPRPAATDHRHHDLPRHDSPHRLYPRQIRENQRLCLDEAGHHTQRPEKDGGQHLAYIIYYTACRPARRTGGQGRCAHPARRPTDAAGGAWRQKENQWHRARRECHG